MTRPELQTPLFHMSSQRHTPAVCLKPVQPAKIDSSSLRILLKCSSFRSEFSKKLIDNPVCFRFDEEQRSSNLHSRPGDSMTPC
jgi:hypothetical protein